MSLGQAEINQSLKDIHIDSNNKEMPNICQRLTKYLPQICQKYAKNMPKILLIKAKLC